MIVSASGSRLDGAVKHWVVPTTPVQEPLNVVQFDESVTRTVRCRGVKTSTPSSARARRRHSSQGVTPRTDMMRLTSSPRPTSLPRKKNAGIGIRRAVAEWAATVLASEAVVRLLASEIA